MNNRVLLVMGAIALSSGCVRVALPEAHIVSGQAQDGLTWQRAVSLALAHHPDLRKARAELDSQAHNRNQALGAYLPSVDGTVSRDHTTGSSSSSNSMALGLEVSQPIFTGFRTTGEAMQAWRQWEASRWAYTEQSVSVRQSLRNAYVELLRLYKLLDVDRRIAQRRQDNADLLKLRYDAGREHEGSSHRAQAIAEQAAFDVRQAERRINSQSLALGRQLGGYFSVPMQLTGDLEALIPAEPQAPGDYAALAEQTPSVLRLRRSAEAAKAAIIAEQSSLWPTVNGTVDYGYSGTRPSGLEKDETTVGFRVSVPLFHGGQNVQGILESNADYKAAVESARSARDSQIALLSQRWNEFRDAWELVSVKKSFLEAARKRAEIVHAQYTTGLASFQDFDIAEQELADSERAYVQALADVLSSESGWNAVLGKPLEEVSDAS